MQSVGSAVEKMAEAVLERAAGAGRLSISHGNLMLTNIWLQEVRAAAAERFSATDFTAWQNTV